MLLSNRRRTQTHYNWLTSKTHANDQRYKLWTLGKLSPLTRQYNLELQRKLESKQAHHATHWLRVHGAAASAGDWLSAKESELGNLWFVKDLTTVCLADYRSVGHELSSHPLQSTSLSPHVVRRTCLSTINDWAFPVAASRGLWDTLLQNILLAPSLNLLSQCRVCMFIF